MEQEYHSDGSGSRAACRFRMLRKAVWTLQQEGEDDPVVRVIVCGGDGTVRCRAAVSRDCPQRAGRAAALFTGHGALGS